MKQLICLILVCLLMGLRGQAEPAETNEAGCHLAVELRDGSVVIGKPEEATLNFHSTTLGDTKLPWAAVRTVDYADDTGTAHLAATNGDGLTVQLSLDVLSLETAFGKTELPLKLIHSIKVTTVQPNPVAKPGAGQDASLQLTIELRDGSHLVGKNFDDTLNFHSTAMGDLKQAWADIRSIEFPTADADSAHVTATNGDIYVGQLVTPTVRVETSFGKNDLPVKLIRSIYVSTAGEADDHLIGWWKLDEGSGTVAKDSSPGPNPHDGILINGPAWVRSPGKGRPALQFNGSGQYVALGNILQDGYQELSVACWINHERETVLQPIVERSSSSDPDGIALAMDYHSGWVEFGHYPNFVQSKADVQDGQWHHVAGTLSQNGSENVYCIYVDGKLDKTMNNSLGLTATTKGWSIGAHFDGTWAYRGLVADLRIYDKALSAAEVEAIYAEQNHGEATSPGTSTPVPPVEADK